MERYLRRVTVLSLVVLAMAVFSVPGWAQDAGKININTASEAELTQLKGVGPKKAASIIQYREEVSPFQTIEDLMKVKGIGEKTFEKIKDRITVGETGENTAPDTKKKG
ncbi:MAG: ComEA family DNA-binding protein [Thermodesulfobacteriota bacterium]